MKKVASVAVSIGVILVIIGLVLIGIFGRDMIKDGFIVGFNHDLSKTDRGELEPIEEIQKIDIKVDNYTVYMLPSEGQHVSVEYIAPAEDVTISVNNDNGVLKIVQEDKRNVKWFTGRNWFNSKCFIAVYIPQSERFANVSVNADTAGIYVKDLHFHMFSGTVKTGAILLENDEFDEPCNATTQTGSVTVKNTRVGVGMYVNTETGSVKVEGVNGRLLKVKTETGSIDINRSNINIIMLEVETGSIVCNADCETLEAKTQTGSIRFETNASDINLVADTGSVKGTVKGNESEYQIRVRKNTGPSNISNQDVEGYLKRLIVDVDTGSIKIYFTND